MVTQFCALAIYAGATIVAVRWLVLLGLDAVATHLSLSNKAKGKLLGYATSIPELVVVVSSAWAGVFEAGFWNIASSNIINWVVFLTAVLFYRQQMALTRWAFIDELVFGILSVAVPVALHYAQVGLGLRTAGGLFALFVAYMVVDRLANPKSGQDGAPDSRQARSLWLGVLALVAGMLVVGVCGRLLGSTAGQLVREIGVPAWLVGWILGFVTSVPEMSSFFAVYALHKRRGVLHLAHGTQETLDALIASNMGNLGVILPIGVMVFELL